MYIYTHIHTGVEQVNKKRFIGNTYVKVIYSDSQQVFFFLPPLFWEFLTDLFLQYIRENELFQLAVAVCCSVLQYRAIASCNRPLLPDVNINHNVIHCNTLQHTATHCNILQHTSTHCSAQLRAVMSSSIIMQQLATHCNTRQHTATHCNTLQHTATHCNILQHTATHCNTLHHTANSSDESINHDATHCFALGAV